MKKYLTQLLDNNYGTEEDMSGFGYTCQWDQHINALIIRKYTISPALSFSSLSSTFFPFSYFWCTLLMFCPPSSCVCCLIAEPPSPCPRNTPGSMYHLLCHLSLSPLLLFSPPVPLFLLLLSCLCLPPCGHLISVQSSHPPTIMDTYSIHWSFHKYSHYTPHTNFHYPPNIPVPGKVSSVVAQGMSSTLSCFSAINYSSTVARSHAKLVRNRLFDPALCSQVRLKGYRIDAHGFNVSAM